MKDVLVIGSGGREHALAWKFLLSPQVDRVYVAPGNAGVDLIGYKAPHNPITETEINLLLNWMLNLKREFGLTWVGPELPLSVGIVDSCHWFNFPVVGPTQAAARIETSKVWAKEFMRRHNIPTAPAIAFETVTDLRAHLLAEQTSFPLVVKEDGLAAGKGVTILQNRTEAVTWLARLTNVTVEAMLAADFQPTAVSTSSVGNEQQPSSPPPTSRDDMDEDALAFAIASGMSAAQVEAVLRGETLTASQLSRTAPPNRPLPPPAQEQAQPDTEEEPEFVLRHRLSQQDLLSREGRRILVEQFLQGREVTVMVFTDGKTIVPMPVVCDYKRLLDGDRGPMTGSMGAYSPPGFLPPGFRDHVLATIIEPAVRGLAAEGTPFKGVLYAGLILTAEGPQVLEFNARFGDPEAQVVLPLLESDLYEIGSAIVEERLDQIEVKWADKASCCVVVASAGYPEQPESGQLIRGMDQITPDVLVFHAGTRGSKVMSDVARAAGGGEMVERRPVKQTSWRDFLGRIELRAPGFGNREQKQELQEIASGGELELRTNGGRVLSLVATAPTLAEARAKVYHDLSYINFPGMQYRTDIALREEYPSEAAMQQTTSPAKSTAAQPSPDQPTGSEPTTEEISDLLGDDPTANMSQPDEATATLGQPNESPSVTLARAGAADLTGEANTSAWQEAVGWQAAGGTPAVESKQESDQER